MDVILHRGSLPVDDGRDPMAGPSTSQRATASPKSPSAGSGVNAGATAGNRGGTARKAGSTLTHYSVEALDERAAKRFVVTHHYSGTYPAAARSGLVRRRRKSHTGPRKPPTSWGRLMYGRSAQVPDLVPALTRGKHRNPRKGACFMELASYLAGERWTDHPRCTHPLLGCLARLVNDHTSDAGRGHLVELVPAVIGLTSDNPHVDVQIMLRSATAALVQFHGVTASNGFSQATVYPNEPPSPHL